MEQAYDGEIQRLTLLGQLEMSPSSSKTRNLISSSLKYGLTDGSYNASTLSVTDAGRVVAAGEHLGKDKREKEFQLAISQFALFNQVYEKLKDNRLREGAVLQDEFRRAGVLDEDCKLAADVFVANLKKLGLVHTINGSEYVKSIEEVIRELPEEKQQGETYTHPQEAESEAVVSMKGNDSEALVTNRPALHIDIQVHIDPTSSAEQIDQIFASMAKHLYGND